MRRVELFQDKEADCNFVIFYNENGGVKWANFFMGTTDDDFERLVFQQLEYDDNKFFLILETLLDTTSLRVSLNKALEIYIKICL